MSKGFQWIDELIFELAKRIQASKEFKNPKPKPLFTTADGVKIYDGDKYYDVWDFKIHENFALETNRLELAHDSIHNHLRFSTKEAAQIYVLNNKPCLSLKDCAIGISPIKFSELVEKAKADMAKMDEAGQYKVCRPKEWEIVLIKHDGRDKHSSEGECGCPIFCVRRISDSEVFIVGEKVSCPRYGCSFIIERFEVSGIERADMMVKIKNNNIRVNITEIFHIKK